MLSYSTGPPSPDGRQYPHLPRCGPTGHTAPHVEPGHHRCLQADGSDTGRTPPPPTTPPPQHHLHPLRLLPHYTPLRRQCLRPHALRCSFFTPTTFVDVYSPHVYYVVVPWWRVWSCCSAVCAGTVERLNVWTLPPDPEPSLHPIRFADQARPMNYRRVCDTTLLLRTWAPRRNTYPQTLPLCYARSMRAWFTLRSRPTRTRMDVLQR